MARKAFVDVSRVVRLLIAVACLLGAAACSGLDPELDNRGSSMENGVFGDLRARKPKPTANEPRGLIPIDSSTGRTLMFAPGGTVDPTTGGASGTGAAGDGTLPAPSAAADVMGEAGAFRLNYENADIKDVVHAVLGEALKVNYTLSPDVAGTITVSSARPVGRTELLGILEATLSAQGYSLTRSGGIYKVGPIVGGAGGTVNRGAAVEPGYGVSIVPLRYASARTISRLLGGFVVDAEGLRVDTVKNAVVIAGPGPKREEAVRTILSFDEDWMKDQTVGIFELRRSKPETLISELEQVFDTRSGGAGVIQFKAITRLNAVMALSRNPALIRRAEGVVRRLDDESARVGANVFVYRAKYRAAKELASIVSGLFGGGVGGGAVDSGGSTAAAEPAADTGFSGGDGASDGSSGDGFLGEQPIDNVTGAGDDQGATVDQGAASSNTGGAPPDVIDLTRQGTSGSSVRISADIANNSVIAYTDAETYRKVLAALQQLDSAPAQVAINVTIAEVRLNDNLKYGVQAAIKSGSIGLGDNDGSIGLQQVAGALAPQVPGFNLLVGSQSNPDLIVSALDQITDVEVLSSPTLMVIENQTATLQVGDQIPVETRSSQSSDSTDSPILTEVEYRDTGIILKVTPRIGDNGAVTMDIAQEISSVVNAGSQRPTISRRRVASFISVIDGQTVVLAGLITSGRDKTRNGLPFLARLPGGDLIGNNDKKASRTELVVLIKPQIIRNGEDAQSVAEDLRSRMWAIGNRETQGPR